MVIRRLLDAGLGQPASLRVPRLLLPLLALGQFAALLLLMERPAKAYVDPGSGLLVFQMLGASVAGGLFFIRRKLRSLFDSKPPKALPQLPRDATTQAVGRAEEITLR